MCVFFFLFSKHPLVAQTEPVVVWFRPHWWVHRATAVVVWMTRGKIWSATLLCVGKECWCRFADFIFAKSSAWIIKMWEACSSHHRATALVLISDLITFALCFFSFLPLPTISTSLQGLVNIKIWRPAMDSCFYMKVSPVIFLQCHTDLKLAYMEQMFGVWDKLWLTTKAKYMWIYCVYMPIYVLHI